MPSSETLGQARPKPGRLHLLQAVLFSSQFPLQHGGLLMSDEHIAARAQSRQKLLWLELNREAWEGWVYLQYPTASQQGPLLCAVALPAFQYDHSNQLIEDDKKKKFTNAQARRVLESYEYRKQHVLIRGNEHCTPVHPLVLGTLLPILRRWLCCYGELYGQHDSAHHIRSQPPCKTHSQRGAEGAVSSGAGAPQFHKGQDHLDRIPTFTFQITDQETDIAWMISKTACRDQSKMRNGTKAACAPLKTPLAPAGGRDAMIFCSWFSFKHRCDRAAIHCTARRGSPSAGS